MTADQLHDAIGRISADLIEETDRKRSRKLRVIPLRRYASLAACLVLLLCGSLIFGYFLRTSGQKTTDAAPEAYMEAENKARGADAAAPMNLAPAADSAAPAMETSAEPLLTLRCGDVSLTLLPDAEDGSAEPKALEVTGPELLLQWDVQPDRVLLDDGTELDPEDPKVLLPPGAQDLRLTVYWSDRLCIYTVRVTYMPT